MPRFFVHRMLYLVVQCSDLSTIVCINTVLMRLAIRDRGLNDGVEVGTQEEAPVVIDVVACQVAAHDVA